MSEINRVSVLGAQTAGGQATDAAEHELSAFTQGKGNKSLACL